MHPATSASHSQAPAARSCRAADRRLVGPLTAPDRGIKHRGHCGRYIVEDRVQLGYSRNVPGVRGIFVGVITFLGVPVLLHLVNQLMNARQGLRLALQLLPLVQPWAIQRFALDQLCGRSTAARAAHQMDVVQFPFRAVNS